MGFSNEQFRLDGKVAIRRRGTPAARFDVGAGDYAVALIMDAQA